MGGCGKAWDSVEVAQEPSDLPLCPQNLLSRRLLLTSSHWAGQGMLILGGPLEEPHALRAQGLDPPTLWGWWNLERAPLPLLRRRPRALQENPGWTVRRRVTMMTRECRRDLGLGGGMARDVILTVLAALTTASSPSCLLRSSCLCHLENAGPSPLVPCPRNETHLQRRMDAAPTR